MATKSKDTVSTFKTAAPFLKRAAVFLVAFVIISGVLGPRIISHGLVDKDGFEVYGGSGKALLFGLAALGLLVWRRGFNIKLPAYRYTNLMWFGLAVLSAAGAWFGVDKLIGHASGATWPIFTHICLLASVVFALGGSFGPAGLRQLARTYGRELLIALVLAVAFFAFLYIVYGLWRVLATVVLHSVRFLLAGVGLHSKLLPPRTLLFSKFGINVAEYCSGIESIALFTALYALVGILDWRRFDHHRFLAAFVPALIILFGFNILRVAVLIVGGYYINPHIAFSLFHTYAGMVFFIIYSLVFWSLSYRWMLRPLSTEASSID